ncbi:MAG: cytochrome c biogenesis protein CcdA, partial [Rhodobacteraceae bacterium]|nr:cytochrome c biogenesis protein CcdA [Paracoccaceae bacterium]
MLGLDIIDATLVPALLIALIAGLFSFVSPCVLPIVPPYLAYMSGMTLNELSATGYARNRALVRSVFFVLGLSVVFVILGLTAAALGNAFIRNQILFQRIAGVVIILFGLHFTGLLRIPALNFEFRFNPSHMIRGPGGAFVLGLAFAFGWTPCIGPQLGAILALAAQ